MASSVEDLRQRLRAAGFRLTLQREAVFRALVQHRDHPRAQDIYERVQATRPGTSCATVYNVLHLLSWLGLVTPLAHSDGCVRYDADTRPHYHARCLECGALVDIPAPVLAGMEQRYCPDGFESRGHTLEIVGVCGRCSAGRPM